MCRHVEPDTEIFLPEETRSQRSERHQREDDARYEPDITVHVPGGHSGYDLAPAEEIKEMISFAAVAEAGVSPSLCHNSL